MPRRFEINRDLEEQLKADPQYSKMLVDQAEPARDAAEQFARAAGAPWMPRRGQTKAVIVEDDNEGVRLVATGYGAHLVEFGSRNNPPHAPLRRGVRAAGLRLDEQ